MSTHDLGGKIWAFFWIDGWKVHFCPNWLLEELEVDARSRNHNTIIEVKGTEDIWWDPGGMVTMGRSYQKLKIDTATMTVASVDFAAFHDELKDLPLRKFDNGQEYYKIHGWLHCTVFSPEQRAQLLDACEKLRPIVDETAKVENDRFIRALDEINEGGLKVASVRDPKLQIEQQEDGKVSIKVKVPFEGQLGGLPNNAKN
jgi:hypothetical protein